MGGFLLDGDRFFMGQMSFLSCQHQSALKETQSTKPTQWPASSFFGRPFVKRLPYAVGPLSICLSRLSVTFVYCSQMVGWINMPLGTEVGLGPGHIVLDGDRAPTQKGHSSCPFQPMSIFAKRSPISATAEHLFHLPQDCWRKARCSSLISVLQISSSTDVTNNTEPGCNCHCFLFTACSTIFWSVRTRRWWRQWTRNCYKTQTIHNYTMSHKKEPTYFFSVTSSKFNRFWCSFQW